MRPDFKRSLNNLPYVMKKFEIDSVDITVDTDFNTYARAVYKFSNGGIFDILTLDNFGLIIQGKTFSDMIREIINSIGLSVVFYNSYEPITRSQNIYLGGIKVIKYVYMVFTTESKRIESDKGVKISYKEITKPKEYPEIYDGGKYLIPVFEDTYSRQFNRPFIHLGRKYYSERPYIPLNNNLYFSFVEAW